MERTILRVALVLILGAAGGFWYLERGIGAGTSLYLPVLVGLAAVGSVNWFGRVRAHERWEAAWDAYATGETEVDSFDRPEKRTPSSAWREAAKKTPCLFGLGP
jgi:hypothetical protein